MPSGHRRPHRRIEFWFSVLFGSLLVCGLLLYVFLFDDPFTTPLIVRFVAALGAGLLSQAFIHSRIEFKGTIRGLVISATGGSAVFCLVFFFWAHASSFGLESSTVMSRPSTKQVEVDGTIVDADKNVHEPPLVV
jgi:hypothetical protein